MKCFRNVAEAALLAALAGCAGASPRGASTAAQTVATASDPRMLAGDATYQDLVVRARALEGEPAAPDTRCVGRIAGAGLELVAEVVPAVRPIADAPTSLDARLEGGAGTFVALTRWGRTGTGSLALAAFTPVEPVVDEPLVAVLVGRRGLYLRSTSAELSAARRGPFPLAELGPSLAALGTADSPVLVTADATVSIATLRGVLDVLGARGRSTALASVLPESTRLPDEPPPPGDPTGGLCEALPDLAPDATEGSLPVDAIRRGLESLRAAVPGCVAASSSGRVARGGRLGLLLRIGPNGTVEAACARQDAIGEPTFRACVLDAARALRFDRPTPPGSVDVALPLVVTPDTSLGRDALCR
ncbi:MAG: hypothetical protein U0230_05350 [Polyangiales bacterium]